MKKNLKLAALLATLAIAVFCFAGCGQEETPEASVTVADTPEAVCEVRDLAMGYVEKYAKELEGEWVDRHDALVAEDLGEATMESDEYAALKEVLDGYRLDCGATYMYALVPNADGDFCITVDGSEEPDTWMENYGFEVQFGEAYDSGLVASARSGWQDGEDAWCWSVFAPLYNSEGTITAIIGIDYPAPVLADYPEWDRDSDSWNGLEE